MMFIRYVRKPGWSMIFVTGLIACELLASDVNKPDQKDATTSKALSPEVRLETQHHPEYGEYLTDSEARTLYIFKRDEKGVSTCYAECARSWPPLLTYGHKVEAGKNVAKDRIEVITRIDETGQVSYNGHALYYYSADGGKGEVKGQDIKDHGAEWYLISPSGNIIEDQKGMGKEKKVAE